MKLSPGKWLNDECINGYISLINQREAAKCGDSHPKSFAFNTFFYTMMQDMHANNQWSFNKLRRIVNKKKI
jgi:Ulp1 family protease